VSDQTKALPRWVAVKGNARGGVLHQAAGGFWRANNWQGCLGGFGTEAEAELAILTAPAKPKRKRAPKAEPPGVMKDWRGLTDAASGSVVRDEQGRAIGGFKPAGDRFEAWFKVDALGEFDTPGQAESAVYAAHRAKKKTRRCAYSISRSPVSLRAWQCCPCRIK
jgi:hypothetical protein